MSGANGMGKVHEIGGVRPDQIAEWVIILTPRGEFLGRPTQDVNEEGRLYDPCYAHAIVRVQVPDGRGGAQQGMGRQVQGLSLMVGIRSARIRSEVTYPLRDLLPCELEELANCVRMAEQERKAWRQQKSGILTPQVVPPTNLRS